MVHEVKENDEIDEEPHDRVDNLQTYKEINSRQEELQRVITSESVD